MIFLENVYLAKYTTFKIGGKARYFCVVKSEEELMEALNFAREKKVKIFVLGGGSNILVSDQGFSGLVIKMEMAGTSYEDEDKSDHGKVLVTAWAGENWDELVAETIDWNVWGLENLSGIPGTVGAAPVQNIGAYGTEVMDLIASVRTMDSTNGSIKVFSNEECKFSYRESFFKTEEGKKYIITAVSFNLFQTPKPNLSYKDLRETFKDNLAPSLSDIREAVIEIRKGKFPELSQVGTAGSFWKNPIIPEEHFKQLQSKYPNIPSFPFKDQIKVPLAWILDNVCHLKGYVQGPISLWKNQPLVVVANENARASDIDLLAAEVAKRVKVETNIDIEREVQYVT